MQHLNLSLLLIRQRYEDIRQPLPGTNCEAHDSRVQWVRGEMAIGS